MDAASKCIYRNFGRLLNNLILLLTHLVKPPRSNLDLLSEGYNILACLAAVFRLNCAKFLWVKQRNQMLHGLQSVSDFRSETKLYSPALFCGLREQPSIFLIANFRSAI
jgi:hypothetical protein